MLKRKTSVLLMLFLIRRFEHTMVASGLPWASVACAISFSINIIPVGVHQDNFKNLKCHYGAKKYQVFVFVTGALVLTMLPGRKRLFGANSFFKIYNHEYYNYCRNNNAIGVYRTCMDSNAEAEKKQEKA
jgi:hypothetical protein